MDGPVVAEAGAATAAVVVNEAVTAAKEAIKSPSRQSDVLPHAILPGRASYGAVSISLWTEKDTIYGD